MVTDDERDYMVREYAKDPRMRINMGIRRRLAPLMEHDRAQIILLHSLLLTLPGTPVPLLRRRDRHGRQQSTWATATACGPPMHWTGDRNAGFSKSGPVAALRASDPGSSVHVLRRQPWRRKLQLADVAVLRASPPDPRPQEVPGVRPTGR